MIPIDAIDKLSREALGLFCKVQLNKFGDFSEKDLPLFLELEKLGYAHKFGENWFLHEI